MYAQLHQLCCNQVIACSQRSIHASNTSQNLKSSNNFNTDQFQRCSFTGYSKNVFTSMTQQKVVHIAPRHLTKYYNITVNANC